MRGRKLDLSDEDRKSRAERMTRTAREHPYATWGVEEKTRHADRMSERNRKNWQNPVYREKQTTMIVAMQPSLTVGKSQAMTEYWADPQHRQEQRVRTTEHWTAPGFRDKFFEAWIPALSDRLKPSGLHTEVKAALVKAGVTNLTTHFPLGKYSLDEADPILKLVVEVNGCFWHQCQECTDPAKKVPKSVKGRRAHDARKRGYLANHGWTLIEIWEHDWNTRPKWCVKQVTNFLKGRQNG